MVNDMSENNNPHEKEIHHWSVQLAEKVAAEKSSPLVITGGMTTSGPAHLGTVCEFLYPAVIKKAMENLGNKMEFHFIGDIMDAFDGIPEELKEYSGILTPELGKPLAYTIDPEGCHGSFGEHYLSEAVDIMHALKLDINVIKATDLYAGGAFDQYTKMYLSEEERVREIVARTSAREVKDLKDWSPIMPICEKCGKIATTRVTKHDDTTYEYACDRDVGYTKGCGYNGKNSIYDHKYKLQWRLHWPTWQAYFNTSIEGSGVDHMTKGGSKDTAYSFMKEFLKRDPPIYYKYGFVLFHGKKYSKSKGIGPSVAEILKLMPPELLAYMLVLPNLEQNKDIDPTGEKLVQIYEDIERISKIERADNRADQKKLDVFKTTIKTLPWKAPFIDILMNYQIYKEMDKVAEVVGDKQGVEYLSQYLEEWISQGYAPEKYNFSISPSKVAEHKDAVKLFIDSLSNGLNPIDIHNLVYEVAKSKGLEPTEMFKILYKAIISKDTGPRIGKLVSALGINKAKEILAEAIA